MLLNSKNINQFYVGIFISQSHNNIIEFSEARCTNTAVFLTLPILCQFYAKKPLRNRTFFNIGLILFEWTTFQKWACLSNLVTSRCIDRTRVREKNYTM